MHRKNCIRKITVCAGACESFYVHSVTVAAVSSLQSRYGSRNRKAWAWRYAHWGVDGPCSILRLEFPWSLVRTIVLSEERLFIGREQHLFEIIVSDLMERSALGSFWGRCLKLRLHDWVVRDGSLPRIGRVIVS